MEFGITCHKNVWDAKAWMPTRCKFDKIHLPKNEQFLFHRGSKTNQPHRKGQWPCLNSKARWQSQGKWQHEVARQIAAIARWRMNHNHCHPTPGMCGLSTWVETSTVFSIEAFNVGNLLVFTNAFNERDASSNLESTSEAVKTCCSVRVTCSALPSIVCCAPKFQAWSKSGWIIEMWNPSNME